MNAMNPAPEETLMSEAVTQRGAAAQWVRRVRESTRAGLRRWRRQRAARKKSAGRKLTWGLTGSLLVLLLVFSWSLSFLYGAKPAGRSLSLDEVQALADQGRVTTAVF
jgi:hypothetical protein